MKTILESKRLLALLCLAAAFSLTATACGRGDDDAPDNNRPVIDTDAGDTDEEDGNTDEEDGNADEEDGDTDKEDGNTDEEDGNTPEVDCQNPTIPGDLVLQEDDWYDDWSAFLTADDGSYFQIDFSNAPGIATVGTLDLATEPSVNILTGEDCEEGTGCQTYYLARSGTLTITAFDKSEGGAFHATLRDIVLQEFDAVENDFVPSGAVSCLHETALSMTTLPLPDAPTWDAPTCADETEGFDAVETAVTVSTLGTFMVIATTNADYPRDELRLELYGDYADGGVYDIDDMNYNTCAACLSIQTHCTDAGGDIDADNCDTRYNAGAGTLTITTIDKATGEFEGLIEGAQFIEVTQQALHSINVEDAAGWCIDSIALRGTANVDAP